jgi:DNA/RNA non-specific endonuclease
MAGYACPSVFEPERQPPERTRRRSSSSKRIPAAAPGPARRLPDLKRSAGNAIVARTLRSAAAGEQVISSATVGIPWESVLVSANAKTYAAAGTAEATGKYFGSVQGQITYRGVDADGRNAGAHAVITHGMTTKTRARIGEHATGVIPYFANGSAPGIHRGHLIAKSLGGMGDYLNWVPLKSTTNVSDMWHHVEKLVYDFFAARGQGYVEVDVSPAYAKDMPVPSTLTYAITFHHYDGGTRLGTTTATYVINNHLDKDTLRARGWF